MGIKELMLNSRNIIEATKKENVVPSLSIYIRYVRGSSRKREEGSKGSEGREGREIGDGRDIP